MRKFLIPAFGAVTAGFALAAVQPAAAEQITVQVPYADLDLATPAGVATLKTRFAVAVKAACVRPDTRDLKAMGAWQHCVAAATEQAAQKVREKVQLASL